MDLNLLIQILISPLIAFTLSTIKNPASVAKLKKSLPVIDNLINALIQLREAIAAKSKPKKK